MELPVTVKVPPTTAVRGNCVVRRINSAVLMEVSRPSEPSNLFDGPPSEPSDLFDGQTPGRCRRHRPQQWKAQARMPPAVWTPQGSVSLHAGLRDSLG